MGGWRKFTNGKTNEVFYLHESGQRERRRPIPDSKLPDGWVKFECESKKEEWLYYHVLSRKTLSRPPGPHDVLPPGWISMRSRSDPKVVYYLHKDTGTRQKGFPCPGVPETLPVEWEKVASSRFGGKPYYFNRATGETRVETDPPTDLPSGWTKQTSKAGQIYYWHEPTGHSQYEKPVPGRAGDEAEAEVEVEIEADDL